jgi:hypothetical protein
MRGFLAVILQPLFFLKNHFNLHEKKPFSKFIIRNLTFCHKRKLKAKWPTYCWNWFPFPLYCTYVFDEVLLQSPGCLIVKMFPASIFLHLPTSNFNVSGLNLFVNIDRPSLQSTSSHVILFVQELKASKHEVY